MTPAAGPDSTAIAGMRKPSPTLNTPPLEPITQRRGQAHAVTADSRRPR